MDKSILGPLLLAVCLLVAMLAGWLSWQQGRLIRDLQDKQRVLDDVSAQSARVMRFSESEANVALGVQASAERVLFLYTTQAFEDLSKDRRLTPETQGIAKELDTLWRKRLKWYDRVRALAERKRTDAALGLYRSPEYLGLRRSITERLDALTSTVSAQLNVSSNLRDRSNLMISYMVGAVTLALIAVAGLGFVDRNRRMVERLAQARREEEAHTRAQRVIESLGDGFFAVDADLNFTYVNDIAADILRRPATDLIGASAHELLPRMVSGPIHDAFVKVRDVGEPITLEHISSEGRHYELRSHAFAGGVATHIRDVTLERARDADARRQALYAEAVVRSVPYGVILTTAKGDVVRINGAALRIRHDPTPPQRIDGWFFTASVDESLSFENLIALVKGHGSFVTEVNMRCPHTIVPVQLGITEISVDQELGYVFVFTDLSAQREARALIEASRDAALSLADTKSAFLANMSHEIRTPLNGILGTAELLEDTDLNDLQREHVRILRDSGDVLRRVINDVLDISKIEAGKMSISKEWTEFRPIFAETVSLFESSAREKGLTIDVEGLEALPEYAEVDEVRLKQIVGNLLGNAIKFSPKGRIKLLVEWRESTPYSGRLSVSVADEGIGIPSDRLGRIFESFSQAESHNARRYQGTGLGLTICKRLVELMGGEITVESTYGLGSTFRFSIPVDVPRRAPQIAPKTDQGQIANLRVLVAEDNDVNVIIARHHLNALGCTMTIVGDGSQALDALAEDDFDIVLMDVHMPHLDGLDATRRWRQMEEGRKRRLPIYAVTASALMEDVKTCMEAGMDGVLHKPYTRADLVEILRKAAQTTRKRPDPLVAPPSEEIL